MGRYITVNITTTGSYAAGFRSWSVIGLVGRKTTGTAVVGTAYVVVSPAEAKTLFGETSALYKSALMLFRNGATQLIVVPATATAETPETFSGTGSATEFTLSKIPAQPIDTVTVASVSKVEGTDFYVDYGNKKIIFYTAPASGSSNISVTYSTHSAANIETAVGVLENYDVQIVVGAMMFDSALLAKIQAHCAAMTKLPRIAVYQLAKGVTDVSLATTLASELSILCSHLSLKDAAAGLAGLIAGLKPWKDLTMKNVLDLEQSGHFTTTQIAAFDAAHIITMYDPPKLTGSGVVCSTGWTLDSTGTLQFIDQVRVAHHLAGVLDFGLTNPNIIGEIKMNRTGMRELDSFIRSLLNPWVAAGEIDNYEITSPARNLFELKTLTKEQSDAIIALQASKRLSGAYALSIKLIYSGAVIYIELNCALTGGI